MDELERELNLARALRWSGEAPPEPDLDEGRYDCPAIGWLPGYETALAAVSYGTVHATFNSMEKLQKVLESGKRSSGSQGGRKLFSKRSDALKVMRVQRERAAANMLLSIDRMIEEGDV